jgi:AraC-like DNA-binding protein
MDALSMSDLLLCSAGGINCIFFSAYLLIKSGERQKIGIILALFLLVTGVNPLLNAAFTTFKIYDLPLTTRILYLSWIIPFSVKAPGFYLLLKYSLKTNSEFSIKEFIHLLPLVIILVINPGNDQAITISFIKFIYILTLIYITLSLRLFLSFGNKFINSKQHNFSLTILVIFSVQRLFEMVLWIFNCYTFESLFIGLSGYIFILMELKHNSFTVPFKQSAKYKNITITEKDISQYYAQIVLLLKTSKLYKETNITIRDLSSRLSLQTYIVSLVINHCYGTNFNDFINSFRLEEAKQKLLDDNYSNKTIESIAFECGFSTLSIFNTYFKKKCNLTPSQFKNFHNKVYCLTDSLN